MTTPRTRPVRPAGIVVAALALSLAVAGCTADTDDAPVPSASADGDAAPGTAEPVEPGELPEIATATATLPAGTVDVVVRSLELDDNGTTMTLRAAFVPHLGGDPGDTYTLSAINNFFFVHPVLLDRQNLKRYSVIRGEGSQDWLTNKDASTTEGEPLESWFVYAAPEDDIETITFTMDAWSVEIPDVPIGGAE